MSDPFALKKRLVKFRAIRKKLGAVRVGMPVRVVFEFNEGLVECYPKERKWVIHLNGENPVTHIIQPGRRIDVTKHKAKLYIKMVSIKLIK